MGVTNEKAGSNPVHLATLISGEDQTNDVIKTEQQFSYARVAGNAQVASSAGMLHSLTFSQTAAAPTAGTITIYDNTAASGFIIYSETFTTTAFRGFSVILDVAFTTGLYVAFGTTNDVDITVSYR